MIASNSAAIKKKLPLIGWQPRGRIVWMVIIIPAVLRKCENEEKITSKRLINNLFHLHAYYLILSKCKIELLLSPGGYRSLPLMAAV
jgi:hypothetical protein